MYRIVWQCLKGWNGRRFELESMYFSRIEFIGGKKGEEIGKECLVRNQEDIECYSTDVDMFL